MAAFSSFHFSAPGALSRPASVASAERVIRRPAVDFAEFAVRVRAAAGEFVLLLWTVSVLAFSALVMAGFFLGK
jgi:hypothetical protein